MIGLKEIVPGTDIVDSSINFVIIGAQLCSYTYFPPQMLNQKLAKDFSPFCVEVYPIEVHHIGKCGVEVPGLPPHCSKQPPCAQIAVG